MSSTDSSNAAPPHVPLRGATVGQANAGAARVTGSGINLTGLWTLYVLTLRQHLHGKRWMVMGGLFLLPTGLAAIARATAPNVPSVGLEFLLACMFIPQGILPLVALVYASGIIQDEQEEQTITYLLIRPIPKWALYSVKLLATMTTTVVLTAAALAITYAAIYIGADASGSDVMTRYLKAAGIQSLAVIAYCSLFGLMSMLTRRTLIAGVIYTVVIEGVLANLPFSIRLATVIYYTRVIAFRTLDFIVTSPRGETENIAALAWQFDIRRDPDLVAYPQVDTCVLVLLASSLICAVVAALICSRREFHVKVPEVH